MTAPTKHAFWVATTSIVIMLGAAGCAQAAPPSPTVAPNWETSSAGPFLTSGLVPVPVDTRAYVGEKFVDVGNAEAHPVDEEGVASYTDVATGERVDHPVVTGQYAVSALDEWHITGEQLWLDRAVAAADHLIETKVERGDAWWYVYPFDWTYYERTLTAPWYSGMAQGTSLSLFARLAEEQPDVERWRTAALHTWLSFRQSRSETEPWAKIIDNQQLWFEEYAGDQPPLLVLNGHIFALYGIYDYFMLTKDPEAALYFDGGATTVLLNMPKFRVPGGVTYYCVQADYCDSPDWQNAGYQAIHVKQLNKLADMTGDEQFREWADTLEADFVLDN